MTIIIRIRNGTLRSRLIRPFSSAMTHLGSGRMPLGSPVTSSTPKGRPMTSAQQGGNNCGPDSLPGFKRDGGQDLQKSLPIFACKKFSHQLFTLLIGNAGIVLDVLQRGFGVFVLGQGQQHAAQRLAVGRCGCRHP